MLLNQLSYVLKKQPKNLALLLRRYYWAEFHGDDIWGNIKKLEWKELICYFWSCLSVTQSVCLTVGPDERSVFCKGIACGEFVGDRRWIKWWISDLLAASVMLVRWITTSHLWPHLLALCLHAGVCVCVCRRVHWAAVLLWQDGTSWSMA